MSVKTRSKKYFGCGFLYSSINWLFNAVFTHRPVDLLRPLFRGKLNLRYWSQSWHRFPVNLSIGVRRSKSLFREWTFFIRILVSGSIQSKELAKPRANSSPQISKGKKKPKTRPWSSRQSQPRKENWFLRIKCSQKDRASNWNKVESSEQSQSVRILTRRIYPIHFPGNKCGSE